VLKICFVTEDFYPDFIGGQGIYGFNLVSNLAKKVGKVVVIAENRKGRKSFWRDKKNIQLSLVPFCFGNQILLALFEYLQFLRKFSKVDFDILHANQLSGLFFVLFRPKNIDKIIVSEWNTYSDMQKGASSSLKKIFYMPLIALEKLTYRLADGILVSSVGEETNFKSNFKFKGNLKVVTPGTSKVEFSERERKIARDKLRKKLNLPKDSKIVLYVGRLVRRKNVDVVLKALIILRNKNIYGVISGRGRDFYRLMDQAPKNVRFLGFAKDLKELYLGSDLFVTVSVAEGGFLLTALEAASYGLPLILSKSASGSSIVREGENGYICSSNPRELSKKILEALKNSKSLAKESKKIPAKFTWNKCVDETLNFYKEIALRA